MTWIPKGRGLALVPFFLSGSLNPLQVCLPVFIYQGAEGDQSLNHQIEELIPRTFTCLSIGLLKGLLQNKEDVFQGHCIYLDTEAAGILTAHSLKTY